jgi:hypothetical protein
MDLLARRLGGSGTLAARYRLPLLRRSVQSASCGKFINFPALSLLCQVWSALPVVALGFHATSSDRCRGRAVICDLATLTVDVNQDDAPTP